MHQPVYPTLDPGVHPLPEGTFVQIHCCTYDEDVDTELFEERPPNTFLVGDELQRWAFEGDVGEIIGVHYNHPHEFPSYNLVFPNGCWVTFDHDDTKGQHYDFHVFQGAP